MSPNRFALLAALALLGAGCGKGLTVNLSGDPNPAAAGQSVTWTLTVRNDTQCDTVSLPTPLPSPIPTSDIGALFVGFDPSLAPGEAASFCRQLMASNCQNESCLASLFEAQFGAEMAQALTASAHAAMQAHQALPANTCTTLENDSFGFAGFCSFDPLSAGETASATYTDTAPNSGNHNPAQFAVAFAVAQGPDCRPGTNVADDFWLLAGCFPLEAATAPAPALSPLATAVGALLVLTLGLLGIRRARQR